MAKSKTPLFFFRIIQLVAEEILISNPLKVGERDFHIFYHENRKSLQTQQAQFTFH